GRALAPPAGPHAAAAGLAGARRLPAVRAVAARPAGPVLLDRPAGPLGRGAGGEAPRVPQRAVLRGTGGRISPAAGVGGVGRRAPGTAPRTHAHPPRLHVVLPRGG